jgi:hypothetical protein
MDKDTRNAIQRSTQNARALLERELGEQLEGTYDIRLDGTIASEPGGHLDDAQKVVREKLVAAVEHHAARGLTRKEAVAEFLREAAFTMLNRFVALKMLEARELVQECVSRGDQSAGFKEFTGLAQGLTQLPDQGYRLYIESLFDEIGQEVGILFDRRDPSSLLWPRRSALNELLDVLNTSELATVWGEDETIGWVYQYFNSGEERRKMRDESVAPRNSRELAVRNQFFTPRYVVRFLVDNTLARMWWQMRGGDTRLAKICEFLVRENVDESVGDKKDPREIKILDPACGSGHFLLYAFDLLTTIYEEAWQDDASPPFSVTGTTLRQDYGDIEQLRHVVPALILGNNLFGVEIDPRAAQIAALALWLRAQRAYRECGILAAGRPRITRTNIVVAEPMPGDAALVDPFAGDLQPPLLGDLFRRMVSEMRLAGELGVLLRVDDAIAATLTKARELYAREKKTPRLPGLEPEYQREGLDFSEIDDVRFFEEAETMLLGALRRFSESAAGGGGVRRWLFSDDAAQGIALIDLVKKRFDVILMNPPFGEPTPNAREVLRAQGSDGWKDIYAGFFESAMRLQLNGSYLGAITSSQYFHTRQMRELRETMITEKRPHMLVDLGAGVLDGAAVQTALAVLGRPRREGSMVYADLFDVADKEDALRERVATSSFSILSLDDLAVIPGKPFCLHSSPAILRQWHLDRTLDPDTASVATGNHTFDDERFLRLRQEVVPTKADSDWVTYEKGGEYQPFLSLPLLLLNWKDNGAEVRAVNVARHGTDAQAMQSSRFWGKPGLCYTHVSSVGFSPRILPSHLIFSSESIGIFPAAFDAEADQERLLSLLGFLASTPAQELVWVFGRYRKIENRAVSGLPISQDRLEPQVPDLARLAKRGIEACWRLEQLDEMSPAFVAPDAVVDGDLSGGTRMGVADELRRLSVEIDNAVIQLLGVTDDDITAPSRASLVAKFATGRIARSDAERAGDTVMWAVGVAFGRWRHASSQPSDALAAEIALAGLPSQPPAAEGAGPEVAIFVDDEGHPADIVAAVAGILESLPFTSDESVLRALGRQDLRTWIRHDLFAHHLSRYAAFKRKAPIYWQLSSESGGYSLWLNARVLTRDTLYMAENDFIAPRIALEERRLASLHEELRGEATSSERGKVHKQEELLAELRALREEIRCLAPICIDTLDDGVALAMAPLWRLVRHTPWQKELKAKWAELADGKYDWAQLAMHLWPERVVPKCATDRSLAIAHGFEAVFWEEGSDGKWQARKTPTVPIDELVRVRSSSAVKDALSGLLSAPVPASSSRGRKPSAATDRTAS